MLPRSFMVFWMLIAFLNTFPQTVNSGGSFEFVRYNYTYSKAIAGDRLITSQMLGELALRLAVDPQTFNLTAQFKVSKDIQQDKEGGYLALIRLDEGEVRGKVFFSEFEFSSSFEPDYANLIVLIQNQNSKILAQEALSRIKISNGRSDYLKIRFFPHESDSISIIIRDIGFFHEPISITRLSYKINQVDNYYAASEILKITEKKLSELNCRQPDMLPECYLTLLEADRVIKYIERSQFQSSLSLGILDPHNLIRRLEIAGNTVALFLGYANASLSSTPSIYPSAQEDEYIENFINGITYYLDPVSNLGFRTVPFQQKLAQLEFQTAGLNSALAIMQQIIQKTVAGSSIKSSPEELLNKVYNEMLLQSTVFNHEEQYIKAAFMIENAERFCQAMPGVECVVESYNSLSAAKYGVYNAYLSVAGRTIETRLPVLAKNYIFMARNYQRDNKRYIINDHHVTILLVKLFDAYVDEATRYNSRQVYDSAMILLQRAIGTDIGISPSAAWFSQSGIAFNGVLSNMLHELLNNAGKLELAEFETRFDHILEFKNSNFANLSVSERNEQLFTELAWYFIRLLQEDADYLLSQNYYREAVLRFLKIRTLAGHLKHDFPENDARIRFAGSIIYGEELDNIVKLINMGNTTEAAEKFDHLADLQLKYGLEYDEAILQRSAEVQRAYLSIRCEQIQSEVNRLLYETDKYIRIQDYIIVMDILDKARNAAETDPRCPIDIDAIKNMIALYADAASYQLAIRKADLLLTNKEYLASIFSIETAEELLSRFSPNDFGMTKVNVLDFVTGKANTYLYWYALRRFIQREMPEHAFKVLALQKSAGLSKDVTSEVQTELGAFMGTIQRPLVPCFGTRKHITAYTKGDRWYRPFSRSYRKALGFCLLRNNHLGEQLVLEKHQLRKTAKSDNVVPH